MISFYYFFVSNNHCKSILIFKLIDAFEYTFEKKNTTFNTSGIAEYGMNFHIDIINLI